MTDLTKRHLGEFRLHQRLAAHYVNSSGVTVVWRWDVDLLVDSHGNQVHVTYQVHNNADDSVCDAVLSTVEYDDPGCHNATTRCSTWNPR